MSLIINESEYCPICRENNNCCNVKDKPLGICWCSKESFPKEIFDLLPANQLGKICVCKNCLEQFSASR